MKPPNELRKWVPISTRSSQNGSNMDAIEYMFESLDFNYRALAQTSGSIVNRSPTIDRPTSRILPVKTQEKILLDAQTKQARLLTVISVLHKIKLSGENHGLHTTRSLENALGTKH